MIEAYLETNKITNTSSIIVKQNDQVIWSTEGKFGDVLEEARRKGYIHYLTTDSYSKSTHVFTQSEGF